MDSLTRLAVTIGGYTINPPGFPETMTRNSLANFAIYLITTIGIISAIAFIIYSGFLWTTSGGDKQKIETARTTLTYSIIGLVIILLSFAIIRLVGSLLGVTLINP